MINFDYIILEKFLQENGDFLLGAGVRKVQQPSRQEIILTMRNFGENRKFYVNINPQFFHICFMNEKSEKLRHIKFPQKPPMFCMLLRKYIENSRIIEVCQPKEERILELYFKTLDETGEEISLCLAIELMGKHSNVILYNYDTNVIIGCMHNVGSEKSRERELFGGLPYVYPPRRKNVKFIGLSDKLTGYVNEFIDNYFSKLQYDEKIKTLKNNLLNKTNIDLKKITNTLLKISQKQKSKESIDLYCKKGDLIMSNLYHNKDFQKEIEVLDYETGEQIKIALDETKTLKENANQFYKLYNKSKKSKQKNDELIFELNENKRFLEEKLFFIEQSKSIDELEDIISEDLLSKNVKVPKITELKIKGYKVYVGKNSRQNDYIVSKIGRKEDIWFHTRLCAGSHVLLRLESGQSENDEIIFECAKLAKQNSSGKNSSKVGVIYTKFKNIKKPPAANLGYVIYKGEKEILID